MASQRKNPQSDNTAEAGKSVNRFYIHVGPHKYEIKVTDDPLYSESGSRARAIVVDSDRTIYIASSVRPEDRIEELAHELWHAHEWHFAVPRDEEERARMFSTVFKQAWRDINQQGGEAVLMALTVQDH